MGLILQYSRLKREQPRGDLIKNTSLCTLFWWDCLVNERRFKLLDVFPLLCLILFNVHAVLVSLMLAQVQWFRKLWGRGQKSRKGAKKRKDKKTLMFPVELTCCCLDPQGQCPLASLAFYCRDDMFDFTQMSNIKVVFHSVGLLSM